MAHQPPKPRRFLRFVIFASLILMMPVFVLAASFVAAGTVTVAVEDSGPDGVDLFVPVPAILLDIAALVVPRVIPEAELAQIHAELEPWHGALKEAVQALEDCPDGVLVEVKNKQEHVLVTKRARRFQVNVDSQDVDVRVSMPDRVLRRALQVLDLG